MSLPTLNAQAIRLLQDGYPDEAVSLLLEALESFGPAADSSIQRNDDDNMETSAASVDQYSQYSGIKEAASEPVPCRRYQEAANRAAEARLRQSRSLDDNNLNYNLQTVDSDVSDISQVSAGEVENYQLAEEADPGHVIDQSQSELECMEKAQSQGTSSSAHLQSIALPEFYERQEHVAGENATEGVQPASTRQLFVSDNIFTFYQRAFAFTALPLPDNDGAGHNAKQSAVVLYNLAVAHHNYAMSRQDPVMAHREFRTALVFYDLAFSTIQESLVDDNNDNDEDFLLLLLAVLNNMGHIHAHHYNYLETQEMLTSLQEILAALRPPSGEPSAFMDHNSHNREDFLFFYKNLVVYEEQEFAAAPAA